jgi:hypothetical protein
VPFRSPGVLLLMYVGSMYCSSLAKPIYMNGCLACKVGEWNRSRGQERNASFLLLSFSSSGRPFLFDKEWVAKGQRVRPWRRRIRSLGTWRRDGLHLLIHTGIGRQRSHIHGSASRQVRSSRSGVLWEAQRAHSSCSCILVPMNYPPDTPTSSRNLDALSEPFTWPI